MTFEKEGPGVRSFILGLALAGLALVPSSALAHTRGAGIL